MPILDQHCYGGRQTYRTASVDDQEVADVIALCRKQLSEQTSKRIDLKLIQTIKISPSVYNVVIDFELHPPPLS